MFSKILKMLFPALVLCAADSCSKQTEQAVFAGGCFWCIETPFDSIDGVISAESGYTGGNTKDPSYDEVSSGITGHFEAVRVTYDPLRISYQELVDIFWRQIDPTDDGGQFADRGSQYRTAIFYRNESQRTIAEKSKIALNSSGKFKKPVVTQILPEKKFYKAEEYHQNYCRKKPADYEAYSEGSGRKDYIKKTWGSFAEVKTPKSYTAPIKAELAKKLTPLQYDVTQNCGTEPAFNNAYWNNHEEGIYVDITTGEPLFSSKDKFDSGTGWPSFTKPIDKKSIVERKDNTLGMSRVEVKSKTGDSHLGHLFNDGPAPTGQRYCLNSASLRFVPKKKMAAEGYGEYLYLFENSK